MVLFNLDWCECLMDLLLDVSNLFYEFGLFEGFRLWFNEFRLWFNEFRLIVLSLNILLDGDWDNYILLDGEYYYWFILIYLLLYLLFDYLIFYFLLYLIFKLLIYLIFGVLIYFWYYFLWLVISFYI